MLHAPGRAENDAGCVLYSTLGSFCILVVYVALEHCSSDPVLVTMGLCIDD